MYSVAYVEYSVQSANYQLGLSAFMVINALSHKPVLN